jgi:6-phosphogluconolactonase
VLRSVEVLPNADLAAACAAAHVVVWLREALAARGAASVALSGGATPAAMLAKLSDDDLDWSRVDIMQVDERVVAAENEARNLGLLRAALSSRIQRASRIHAMPVEERDLALAAARYAELLRAVAGVPPVLDAVQLGLGVDGHTASLMPGDPALEAVADVVVTAPGAGLRRMTLTLPAINRARRRLFLVTGASKRAALERLARADATLVAARVERRSTWIVADAAAARGLAAETRR